MKLRPCPYCHKPIPSRMVACPYCHRDEKGDPVEMDTAAPVVEKAPVLAVEDLQALVGDDPYVREQAVSRVAAQGVAIAPALIHILAETNKTGLAGIAKTLGRIGDRRALPALIQAAKRGDDDLRTAALQALAQFHEPEVLPVLLSEAERAHPVTQSYLAYVLSAFPDPEVIEVLGQLALHGQREVSFQAAYALGDMPGPQSARTLRRVLRRKDAVVRQAAAFSLERMGISPTLTQWSTRGVWMVVVLVVAAVVAWLFYR